jgi:CDGSH-type Zn-finger protein
VADVEITPTENGPYKVTGTVQLTDPQGRPIKAPGAAIFLCRCGGSANKPFCDGTHAKIGFDGTLAAQS